MELTERVLERITTEIVEQARRTGKAFTVAIVDEAGYLRNLLRMDGAGFITSQIAEAKAFSAAAWGKSTNVIAERARAKPETFQAFSGVGRVQIIPGEGGMPLFAGTRLIGAVGVSGGSGEEDDRLCAVGVKAFAHFLSEVG